MLRGATLTFEFHFTEEELWVAMLSIFGFSQKSIEAVTGLTPYQIKTIIATLCKIFHGSNASNMACHAQEKGFNRDGTLNGKDIFSDEMKHKILDIDPDVKFRFPLHKKRA